MTNSVTVSILIFCILLKPKPEFTKEGAVVLDYNDLVRDPEEIDLSESIEVLFSKSSAVYARQRFLTISIPFCY